MLPLEETALFVMASIALAFAPGPDNIFVLMQSALYGPSRGIMVTLGLCTGLIVHTAAVSLGVAALLQASEVAFDILKYVGAAYLLWLAWKSFRATAAVLQSEKEVLPSYRQLYLRGIFLNVTNPKVAIFFLAFLPQFTDPQRGSAVQQMLFLGALFMLVTLCVFSFIAAAAGTLGNFFRKPKAQANMNRFAGIVFLLLALRLAISTQ